MLTTRHGRKMKPNVLRLTPPHELLASSHSSAIDQAENLITVAICTCLILWLCIATVCSCFASTSKLSNQENRSIAPIPTLRSIQDLREFPGAFEKFVSDRFAYRLPLIAARSWISYNLLHASTNSKVVIGKRNWLFYNDDNTGLAQRNSTEMSTQELEAWANELQARQDFLQSHGIKYLFVIAPEKGSIYPELMPDSWVRRAGWSRIEQLQNYLRLHTTVDFVDAKSILMNAKLRGDTVYLPRDTHWNPYGAFLVSQEIFEHLNRSFPAVRPLEPHQFRLERGFLPADLAKMLGLGDQLHDDCFVIVPAQARAVIIDPPRLGLPQISRLGKSFEVTTNDPALPKALVLRDSFCGFLAPFLSEHFSCTEYHWTNVFDTKSILREHPDVVVNEVAERFLYSRYGITGSRYLP
jgi:alginate O-acetyltransferase complex protein AlgJ